MKKSIFRLSIVIVILALMLAGCILKPKTCDIQATVYGPDGLPASFASVKVGNTVLKADANGTVRAKVTSGKVAFSALEAGSQLISKEVTIDSNRSIRLELDQRANTYGFIYRKVDGRLKAIYVIPQALSPKAAVFEGKLGLQAEEAGKGHFLFTQEIGDKTRIEWSPLLEGESKHGLYYAFSIPVEGEIEGQVRIYQGTDRSVGDLPEIPLTDEERAIHPDSVLAAVGDVVAPFGRVDVQDLVDFLTNWKGAFQAKYDLGSISTMDFDRPNATATPKPFNASGLVKDSAVNVYDLLVLLNAYKLATSEIAGFTNINKPFPVTNVNAVVAGSGYNVTWSIQHVNDVQESFDVYVGDTSGALTTLVGTATPKTATSYTIPNSAHAGKYVSVVAKNGAFSSEKAAGPALPPNTVTVNVTFETLHSFIVSFSEAYGSLSPANFALSIGTVTGVTPINATQARVMLSGLSYGITVTITVSGVSTSSGKAIPTHTQNVTIPGVSQFYELVLVCDATGNAIPSDGLSSTMLTATLYDKATGLTLPITAQVQFTATLGSLSQANVGLSGAAASTQLRSVSSLVELTSYVKATIISSTERPELVGLESNTLVVFFVPGGTLQKVRAIGAGASWGDRFWVDFSGPVSAQLYKSVVLSPGWNADIPYGIRYIPKPENPDVHYPLHIIDVIQSSPNRLTFIFDADHFHPILLPLNERSMAPGVSNALDSWLGFIPSALLGITKQYRLLDRSYTYEPLDTDDPAGPSVGNFFRDNIVHTIFFPEEVTGVVEQSNPIGFQFSDVTAPFVYGLTVVDNCNLIVEFSEPICETLAETPKEKDDNPHFTIDGKRLYFVTTPGQPDIDHAVSTSRILITDLYVGKYDAVAKKDDRHLVFIKIYPEDHFKLAVGNHILQIHNVGDWAGWTDPDQNRISTQSYPFTVNPDTVLPVAEVIRQSPEQFLIRFNRKVKIEAGKKLNEALIIETPAIPPYSKITTKMVPNSFGSQGLTPQENITVPEYIVTAINEDGTAYDLNGKKANLEPYALGESLPEWDLFLVEFIQDWSVIIGDITSGYWNTGSDGKRPYNPLTFRFNYWETTTGLKMTPTDIPVANPFDGVSPKVVETRDLFAMRPNMPFRNDPDQPATLFPTYPPAPQSLPDDSNEGTRLSGITAFENSEPGKYIYVEMDEPVQLISRRKDDHTKNTGRSNPTTPNLTQLPGQNKNTDVNKIDGMPPLTVQFNYRADPSITTTGALVPGSVSQDDKSFVVRPVTKLTAGVWDMYIQHMPDDHGNSYETIAIEVNVPVSTVSPKVAWIGFLNDVWVPHDGLSGGEIRDVIQIKFTDTMSVGASNGVDKTTNYKFRGYGLPAGSYIYQGIHGLLAGPGLAPGTTIIALTQQLNHAVTTGWDGVTIVMPRGAWDGMYGGTDFSCNITLAENFKSKDGRTLDPTSRQVELTHTFDPKLTPAFPGKNPAINDDPSSNIYPYNGSYYQAVYVNNLPMNLSLKSSERRFIIGAVALDLVTGSNYTPPHVPDGRVDTLAFLLDRQILDANLNPNQYVYVNGIRSENFVAAHEDAEAEILASIAAFTTDPQVVMWEMDFPISQSPSEKNDAWVFVELKGDAQFPVASLQRADERDYEGVVITSSSGNKLIGGGSCRPLNQFSCSCTSQARAADVPANEIWVWGTNDPNLAPECFNHWFQNLPVGKNTLLLLPSEYATNVLINQSGTYKSLNSGIPGYKSTRGPEAIVRAQSSYEARVGTVLPHYGWAIERPNSSSEIDVEIDGLVFQPAADFEIGKSTLYTSLISVGGDSAHQLPIPNNVKIRNNIFDTSIINTSAAVPVSVPMPTLAITIGDLNGAGAAAAEGIRVDRNLIVLQHQNEANANEVGIGLGVSGISSNPNQITNNVFSIAGRNPISGGSAPIGIFARPLSVLGVDTVVNHWNMTGNTFKTTGTGFWNSMMEFGSDGGKEIQEGIFLVQNVFGGKAYKAIRFFRDNANITVELGSTGNVFNGTYDGLPTPIDVGVWIFNNPNPALNGTLCVNGVDANIGGTYYLNERQVQNLLK